MTVPKLEDLPNDVYNLFDPNTDHRVDDANLEILFQNLRQMLHDRLGKQAETVDRPIRFSALGKPDRQVWYDAHPDGSKEPMSSKTYLKFLYGAVIEELFLFLAREAGHDVQDTQRQVEIDGITGSIDAIIDGTVVDVKSASSYGYKKFRDKSVTEDDPFGYVEQLSGYANVLTPGKDAAWWAIDKVNGSNCISPLKKTVIEHHQPAERIAKLKEVIASETEPERCYEDVEDGKSGNRKLGTRCSYCAHKFRCWPGLRSFIYSTGPRYLTVVGREPDVPEVQGFVEEEG